MKKIFLILIVLGVALGFQSCDHVENPIKPAIDLDTTLFPGNWEDYPTPTFTQNSNSERNVMIEDYTGHRCPNCPAAATVAHDIEAANAGRVFVVSVHASTNGISNFQETYSTCGTSANPENEFCEILYCDEGLELGATFGSANVGFFGNPAGSISRKTFGSSEFFSFYTEWATNTDLILNENDLKVNIQAQSNYYPSTNGVYLHTELEFLEDLNGGSYNTVVYVIENEMETWQDSMGTYIEEYHHHNILRGCIDDLTWGQSIIGDFGANAKHYFDYSYSLPSGITNSDYHLLIYVYDVDTYEVLQVIKHEF